MEYSTLGQVTFFDILGVKEFCSLLKHSTYSGQVVIYNKDAIHSGWKEDMPADAKKYHIS